MFKYSNDKLLEHKKLGGTQHSWVCPYKEGKNENEWVVKYIHAKDQTEMNDVLQNIFLTTSSDFSGLVPIKGYDVQANERGDYSIYCKIPRMMGSLKSIIDWEYSANNLLGSTEKLVLLLHSLVSTLDDLAQERTFHRNLKPTNIFVDKLGHPFLSDLKMNQSVVKNNGSSSENEQLMYIAPEALSDSWAGGEDNDIHKSDVWSLGMIMAKLCLLDKLIPLPTDVPLQEVQEAIDMNIGAIKERYGANFSRILSDMLNVNPGSRRTFEEIRKMLEVTFLYTLEKNDKKMNSSRRENKGYYDDSDSQDQYSDPFLKIDNGSSFRKRRNFEISLDYEDPLAENLRIENSGYQKFKRILSSVGSGSLNIGNQAYQKLKSVLSSAGSKISKGAKDFKEGKGGEMYEKAKELKGSVGSRICQKFRYFRDVGRFQLYEKIANFGKRHKFKIISIILVIIFITAFVMELLHLAHVERQKQEQEIADYNKVISGFQIKNENNFIFESFPLGRLAAQLKPNAGAVPDPYRQYWENDRYKGNMNFTETVWIDFTTQLFKELESKNFTHFLTHIELGSNKLAQIASGGLEKIGIQITSLIGLKKIEFKQISGEELTTEDVLEYLSVLAKGFPNLERLGVEFLDCSSLRNIPSIVSAIFSNFKNLTELKLGFEGMAISNDEMNDLASIIRENGSSLTLFAIHIKGTDKIDPRGFNEFNSEFYKGFSNLIDLHIDYSNTNIENEALYDFSENISTYCKKLKRLVILLGGSEKITRQAASYFILHLPADFGKGLIELRFESGRHQSYTLGDTGKYRSSWNQIISIN